MCLLFDEQIYYAYEKALNQLQASKIVHSQKLDEINRMLRNGLLLVIQVHHAVSNGYHVPMFIEQLQKAITYTDHGK